MLNKTANVKPHVYFIIAYLKMNNATVNTLSEFSQSEDVKKILDVNWYPGLFTKLVFLATLAVLSSTANILLMYIATRTRSLVNNTKVFFISLCSAHLLGSIIVIPMWISSRLSPELANSSPAFCQTVSFFWILMILASFYSLSALSLDRFFIISNPMRYPIKATTSKKLSVVVMVWIFCIVFASSPMIGWGEYKFQPDAIPICGLNMKYSLSYTITLIVIGFCAPLIVDIFCCGRIISIARRQSRSIESRKGSDGSTSSSMSTRSTSSTKSIQPLPKLSKLKQKINSLRLVFAGTGSFLVCWLPYLGAHIWMTTIRNISHQRESMPYIMEFVVMCIGLFNGFINPVVLMLSNRDYRKEIKSFMCKRFRNNTDDRSDTDSITNNAQYRRQQFQSSSLSKAFNVLQEANVEINIDDTNCNRKSDCDVIMDCVFDTMPPTPPAVDHLSINTLHTSPSATFSECKRLMSRSTGSSSELETSVDLTTPCEDTKSISHVRLMRKVSSEIILETLLEGNINCDETIK